MQIAALNPSSIIANSSFRHARIDWPRSLLLPGAAEKAYQVPSAIFGNLELIGTIDTDGKVCQSFHLAVIHSVVLGIKPQGSEYLTLGLELFS